LIAKRMQRVPQGGGVGKAGEMIKGGDGQHAAS
jgi:hypothetical protein